MKIDYSKIHPELQQIAKKSPKMTFSNMNLWLVHLVMNLMPASKTPEDILVENISIPGQDDRAKSVCESISQN